MKKLKVFTVVGTRPEIIRLSRVITKLDVYCEHTIIHTGQNYDYELNQIFFDDLKIRKPNYFLDTKLSILLKKIGLFKLSKFFLYEIKTHEHAYKVKKFVGQKVWNTYYKFCVEREPVDKCLSYYFMRKNSPTSSKKRKSMTWSDFVKKGNFPIDYNFYTYNNELIVDKIINYEIYFLFT